jgi:putative MATE family efflux protein
MPPPLLRQIIRPPDDLTKGSIPRNVVILSLPIALTQSFTVVFRFVDTVFVGRLAYSRDALAAVGAAGQVMFFIITMLIGLTIGTTAMVARFVGEKEPDKAAITVFNSFVICLVLSITLAVIGVLFSRPILVWLEARGHVLQLGIEYLEVLMVASVAMIMLFLIGSILQGAGDAITPMWLFGGANLLNLVLDPFFIYDWFEIPSFSLWVLHTPAVHFTGLDMGVRGAALATVIGRGLFCVIGVFVLRRGLSRVHVKPKHFRIDLSTMRQLLFIGVPSALQMMIRAASGVLLFKIVGRQFGPTAMAALRTGQTTIMLALMPGFGIGRAAGALAGQNLGAKKPDRAIRSVWTSVAIYSSFMALCSVAGLLFPRFFMRLFTNDAAVIATGAEYLRFASSVYLFTSLAIVLGKSMEGAGYTLVPMLLTAGVLGFMVLLAWQLPSLLGIGIRGVWIAMVIAYTLHAAGALIVFRLGHWKARKIEIDYREVAIPPQESVAAPE